MCPLKVKVGCDCFSVKLDTIYVPKTTYKCNGYYSTSVWNQDVNNNRYNSRF